MPTLSNSHTGITVTHRLELHWCQILLKQPSKGELAFGEALVGLGVGLLMFPEALVPCGERTLDTYRGALAGSPLKPGDP
jgi:hypothetical protein